MLISRRLSLKFQAISFPVFIFKQIILFALLITIFLTLLGRDVSLYIDKNRKIETISSKLMLEEGKYIFDRWQAIGDPVFRYRIYAAYFDDRLEIVGKK